MKKDIQTWKIVQSFVHQLKRIFEQPDRVPDEQSNCPTLTFQHQDRIVLCRGTALRLSPLLWWLLIRLVESPDGTLEFIDSCIDETRSCPWRHGEKTLDNSRRCTACRLSIRLWEAGFPFKVKYSRITNSFTLILLDENEQTLPVVAVTSGEFMTTNNARKLKKLVKALIFLIPVLQFQEVNDLEAIRDMISPVSSELPNVKSPQDS